MVRRSAFPADRQFTDASMNHIVRHFPSVHPLSDRIRARMNSIFIFSNRKDRQKKSEPNGFTVAEALLVLLIACVLMVPVTSRAEKPHLDLFMEELVNRVVSAQEFSYANKQAVSVEISERSARFMNTAEKYPDGIVCEPVRIEFSRKGNILKGGSTICTDGIQSQKLIFQIGTGRIRHEQI